MIFANEYLDASSPRRKPCDAHGHGERADLETVEGDRVRNAAVTADDFDRVKITKQERRLGVT